MLRTETGQRVAKLTDDAATLWVPDGIFDVEVNAAVRKLELYGPLSTQAAAAARPRLFHLRLRRARVAALADRARQIRHNISFPDACYVALT